MRRYLNMKRLTGILLLLFLVSNMAWAEPTPTGVVGIDPPVMKVLDGSQGQLKVDSFIVVEDAKFFDPAYNSLLIKPYAVKNIVSLEINEDAHIPIPEEFDTWVTLQITVTHADGSVEVLDDKTLYVGYANLAPYTSRSTFVFDNAYRVEVKIKELKGDVNPEIWKVLKVVNQLQSLPQYNFSCTGNAVTAIYDSAWAANTTKDELPVYWAPSIGADEYDLEWTYIDASALARGEYGNPTTPDPSLIFDNNASRVTIAGTYYKIPIIYDNTGHLFFRVRPVQWQAGGGRTEAHWSSDYTNGLGRFNYNGHERPLNWQATTTFAEEGKRKTVVQYYDGSLRSRQTVTKDNSSEKTIVAESLYDYQGRPVIQVLPAPTLNSVIGYTKNFNRGLNSASGYDKSLYDTLASADLYCTTGAPAMATTNGAAQYYSPANPLADSGFNKYIPDAEGYPFTEVEYAQDNTGRISRQSGVGKTFRIGSGHETKYYYGTPDQRELDALFGTEVGHFSHYFKTMVRDANGQYSVAYADMRGRTIATALAGVPPDSIKLDSLSSYTSAVRTEKLSDPAASVIKDWVMENKKGLLVSKAGDHTFTYKLDPQTLQQEGCTQPQICYECLYDLQITITDDCNNQKLGGVPFDTVIHNFQIGQIDTSCNSNSGGFSLSFTKFLEEGSYEVTKKLSISRYGFKYYRDSIFLKANTCKTIEDFIQEQRQLLAGVLQCKPTCQGCKDSLGTWDQFWARFRQTSGIADTDTASYRNMALTAYTKAQEDCAALCDSTTTEANDIRRNMLMDMTPSSGQYANIDSDNDILSVFFSSADGDAPDTTAKYQDVTNYLDANGNPDMVYDEGSGQLVAPQNLSPEVFAQKFKLSWAEALLHLHPEYCKLQRYEQLKASHEWDKRFAETDTWQEAREKGYLNPIRDGSFPAHLNGAGTDVKDPLAEFKNGLFNSKLKDSLLKYRNIQGGTISLWAVASVTTMCQRGTDNQACFQTYSNNTWAMNPDTMCVGELNMAWRAYRQMYLDVKRYIINKYWIKDSCNSALTAAQLMQRGFTPHFSDADELAKAAGGTLPSDTTQAKNEIGNKMDNYYQSNCQAYATQWMQQLSKCSFYDSAIITDIIIPQLVQVCMEGSDVNHPYGASSVKPSSNNQFRSFEEVINNYNQTHGITDFINCNSYRITAPKPYDQQSVFGNKPIYNKPEDCECEAIAGYYNKYLNASGYSSFSDYLKKVYNTSVTEAALNQLLSLCKVNGAPPASCSYLESPLFLPPAFQCYTGDICIGCEQFKTADQAFRSKFPGISPLAGMVTDSIQTRNNLLYEQFMNYRFGFAKTVDEYLAFAKGCKMPVDSVSELQSIVNGYKASTSAASSWHYVGTNLLINDPHQIFRDGQIKLPDSYHSTPAYCCVSPVYFFGKTVCLPDGYLIEARIKTTGWLLASLNVYSTDSTTAGGYICEFQSDGNTIYGGSFIDGRNQFVSGQTIATVPGSLADWHVVKIKVTKTAYEQYVDGQLIRVYQKVPRLYGQPVGPIPGIFLSFASMEAAVDWVKLSDINGIMQYFEDFNDPDNQSPVNGNAVCPSATCTTDFANYFNQQKGTSYNFSQIDSLYLANGIALNVCTVNPVTADSLTQLANNFKTYYRSNYGVTITFSSQEEEHYTDFHDLIHDGHIQLPDTIRARPGQWYNNVGITTNGGKFFNWTNGYAVEYRMKFLQDLLSGHVFYINAPDFGLVISRYGENTVNGITYPAGIYLSGFQSNGNNKFGYDYGDASLFTFKLINTNTESILDWNNFKVEVKPTYCRLYVNGTLIQEIPRDNLGIGCGNQSGLGLRGRQGAVDWIKIYDGNDQVQYFEDFMNADNPVVPDNNFWCNEPAPDCQSSFAQYFNQQRGTAYTFSQIESLYSTNGIALNVCSTGVISCDSLMTIYNNAVCLYNSLSDPLVNTHQCNIGNWVVQGVYNATNKFFQTNELVTPSIISNGYIHMPYPDSSTRYGAVGYSSQRQFRVQNEYALEARVRNIGGTDVDFFISNHSIDDPGYERDEDFYIAFIPQWTSGYYNLQGVRYYDEAFGGKYFNDWRTVKYVVKPDRFQAYFEGQLIKEVMRDGHHYIDILGYPYIKGNVGESVQVDWIKMYGAGDSLMFYENFDNYPSLSRPDPFFLLPRQDCKPFFEQYFNSRTGKNLTYDQIKAFYSTQCGATIDFCPEETTLTLCGRAEPVFPPVALDDINNCSDTTFIIASKAQELYNVYLDSLKGHFDSSYIAKCLQAYKLEQFTVRHAVSEYHHTLYYYDLAGNLVKTVPPAGVRANYDSLWLDSVDVARIAGGKKVPAHELVTQYRYNTLNSVVSHKSPDGGKTEFWYDRLGRLAISRNARQKAVGGLFSYTRYDALGRITEVGQLKDPAVSQVNDNLTRNEMALNNWFTGLAGYRGQVTNTIYDVPYSGFGNVNSRLIVQQKNVRNRVSYISYSDSPGVSAAYNTATFYSYDIHGNVDTLLQDYGQSSVAANIMNTQNNRFKKLVYQYDLISGKVNMVMYQPGWSDRWYHRYRYDAENRLVDVETSLDSLVWEKDARYEYYRHGPLARMVLGQQQVQGIDYAYTLQGWLKGVNSTGATIAHDMGGDGKGNHLHQYTARDAYGYTLNYFAGEYKAIGNGVNPFPGYSGRLTDLNNYRPLYNGNISSMSVYNRRFEGEPGGPLHFYNYRYDQLNRLTGQDVYKGFDTAANNWNGMTGNNDYLKERIAYDANGNILKYLRNAMSGSAADMDSLTYKYYKGTNQLRQVRDAVGDNTYQSQEDNLVADIDNQTDTSNYVYDEIGNLVKDKAESISNIKWSVYGKILEITRAATDKVPVTIIQYTYDAQGNRIGKITDAGGEKQYTWYVRDAQGNIITTYTATGNNSDLSALQLKQEERYIYGSSRLGMYSYPDVVSSGPDDKWASYSGTTFDRGFRQYELNNHLGNVLVTLSDKKFGVPSETNSSVVAYYKPDIRGAQDYYPFGMLSRVIPDRSGKNYRFGFNGKENDNDVKGLGNQQDYGMRIYDPRVGRFLSVDPITKEYPELTPYQYASNRPIDGIDIDGKEWSKTETYDPQTGITHIHFQVKLKIENSSEVLTKAQITAIGDATVQKFKEAVNVFDEKRKVQYSGDLQYEAIDGQLSPNDYGVLIGDDYQGTSKGKITGITGEINTQKNIFSVLGNNAKTGKLVPMDVNEVGLTIVHEMAHTANVWYHPMDEPNNFKDVDLTPVYFQFDAKRSRILYSNEKQDGYTFLTYTPSEGASLKEISQNIMMYNNVKVNGKKYQTAQLTKISPDQANAIPQQIDKDTGVTK